MRYENAFSKTMIYELNALLTGIVCNWYKLITEDTLSETRYITPCKSNDNPTSMYDDWKVLTKTFNSEVYVKYNK